MAGDEPTYIASGFCSPDPATYAGALLILEKYKIAASDAVQETRLAGCKKIVETPKGSSSFNVNNQLMAAAHGFLTAAERFFPGQAYCYYSTEDSVTDEVREVAEVYAELSV